MTAPEALPISSSRKKKKKNPTGASKESFRKMRRKNQTRKRKKKQAYSSDSSIPPSSSSDYSSDSGNAHTRIRTKENDNYKKKRKRYRRSRSPSRDRTKSKRRKLEGSERKGAKTKLKEKRKRRKKERLKFGGRDASVSSDLTPRSQSCSTCRSSSPDDLRRGRSSKARSFSRSKKIKKYDDRKMRRGRNRSPIYLSSDHSSRSHSLERIGEKSSLRRSKEAERGYGFDGRMEISTQDHVDFLSSKSNDSFDGSSWREPVGALERYAGKDDYVEGEEKDAAFVVYVGNDGRSGPSTRIKSIVVVPAANDAEEEDLESLLRQKALENLKKFRGKSYSLSAKSSIHQNVEDLKTQLPGTSDGRICTEKVYDEDGCSDGVNVAFKENLTVSVGDKADVQGESHQLELSGDNVAKPLRRIVSLTRTKEISNGGEVTNPPNVGASPQLVSTKTSSSYTSNIKKHLNSSNQVQSEQENQNENLFKQASVECGISEMENADQSDKVHQGSTSKTSSTIDQSAGQEITNAPKSEARNDSELEEKTMTVMRGGEMVQVSYKVYIPKKTPALVRRQLKR